MLTKNITGPLSSKITQQFLPNSIQRICNYGSKGELLIQILIIINIIFISIVFCGQYSKDGSHFLTASQDRCLRIYETRNGGFKKIRKIKARDVGWSILDVGWAPDGRSVVYSSWDESREF
jgi:WD40 repeat protein